MIRFLAPFVLALLLLAPALAGDLGPLRSEAELDAALQRAQPGDTLILGVDLAVTKPRTIPSGVTLDGQGHALTASGTTVLIQQDGQAGVVIRRATLATPAKSDWAISVRDGSLCLEDCRLDARIIAWDHGALEIVDCTYTVRLPHGSDGAEPIGAYGDAAVLSATRSLFVVGWEHNKLASGLFHNMGGNIASRLSLSHCTIIGTTDAHPDQGGRVAGAWRQVNRHLGVIRSDNAAGGDYLTTVSSCVILAEASSVFFTSGSGTVRSDHNNNAGMLRNPFVFPLTRPYPPAFYQYSVHDNGVTGRDGDFEETNPFVNAFAGDYRLVASSRSARGARDGGPVGAPLGVAAVPHNAFNLSFSHFDTVPDLVLPERSESLFYGWPLHREHPQQYFLSTEDGYDDAGRALRLEVRDTVNETGGMAHDRYLTQSVFQRIIVNPGWLYTVRVAARRGTVAGRSWAQNGMYGNAVLGVVNGHVKDPHAAAETVVLRGPEGEWVVGEIRDFRADSNHLTLHLIHRTNGSHNYSDWDAVTIEGRPNPDLEKTAAQ